MAKLQLTLGELSSYSLVWSSLSRCDSRDKTCSWESSSLAHWASSRAAGSTLLILLSEVRKKTCFSSAESFHMSKKQLTLLILVSLCRQGSIMAQEGKGQALGAAAEPERSTEHSDTARSQLCFLTNLSLQMNLSPLITTEGKVRVTFPSSSPLRVSLTHLPHPKYSSRSCSKPHTPCLPIPASTLSVLGCKQVVSIYQ